MKTHISHYIEEYKNATTFYRPMFAFGVKELDDAIHGFSAGEMITLLGDPGSGKTSMTIRLMDSLAVERQIPVLYFCIRNTSSEIIKRLVDYRCPLQVKKENVIAEVSKAPVYLYSSYSLSIEDVCDVCREHVREYGIKTVFVHYSYISSNPENAYSLRILAKELELSIVILENVFEYREGFDGVLPNLRDLNYSRLGEYSDTVIGLCDYASYHMFQDENGRDLRELLHVSVLKCHGVRQDCRFYIKKDLLKHK